MRAYVFGFAAAITIAAALQTASAGPLAPSGAALASAPAVVLVKHHCGEGYRWVPAGYAKHGKYRAAHCAPA